MHNLPTDSEIFDEVCRERARQRLPRYVSAPAVGEVMAAVRRLAAPTATSEPVAIPERIRREWLREIAQEAGFNLNMLGELVVPSPHHDAEPYLRRLIKLLAVPEPQQAAPLTDDAIERAALKHVAPGWKQLASVTKLDPDYRKSEQFTRLKAFALELSAGSAASAGDARDAALKKINDIRNSIIGLQSLNWSEHVYPLVAALDEAGYEGMGYPAARKYYGTLLERAVSAEDKLAAMATTKEGAKNE